MNASLLQPARGTKDLLPEEFALHLHVIETARAIASCYGYQSMTTPLFEFTEVFKRTLGDTSDVVTKEMYSFEDRGGESVTLRPEFTAGIARAFISNGLSHHLPLRFFSTGPLFRYERPQKGRYRQFHQINMECLGIDAPEADSETIAMGAHILKALGILPSTKLLLNSLGDTATRLAYRTALVEYFSKYQDELSEDSKVRLAKNPLRILDSKDPKDKELLSDAPTIASHYSPEAKKFFDKVCEGLTLLGVEYHVTPHLVRGLDYYNHTAFEFITDALGAQNTVMAGGRYDGLVRTMGGPDTPAIGFAAGIERLCGMLSHKPAASRPIALIPIGEAAEKSAYLLADHLRQEGFYVQLDFSGNVSKRMKQASKRAAKLALFMGDEELQQGIVKLRDLDVGEEQRVTAAQLIDVLAERIERQKGYS